MTRFAAVLALVLLAAYPADAACFLNLRVMGGTGGQPLALVWDVVSGSTSYEVRESRDNFATSTNTTVYAPGFVIPRRASHSTKLNYRVTAQLGAGLLGIAAVNASTDACVEQIEVTIPGDPAFRQLTRRAIVPLAGSTRGANGSLFRTSMEMRSTNSNQHGRIIFRSAGSQPSDSDPSVQYAFEGSGLRLEWRDIVAATGGSGIGSLEIIPDESSEPIIPATRVRLYQDGGAGTFGTYTAPVYPFDYLSPVPFTVQMPDQGSRVNLGFRTLSSAVTIKAIVYDGAGRIRRFYDIGLPPNFTVMDSIGVMLGGHVDAGERVVFLPAGPVIGFHTLTDNQTNDPALFVAPASQPNSSVDDYVQ